MNTNIRSQDYTVPFLAQHLLDRGLITERQRADVVRNEGALRDKINRRRAREFGNRKRVTYEVSPVEVVAEAAFSTADGRGLSEDRLMVVVADIAGVPYRKIDPLKLNHRLITDTMSRPFARRHVCTPIEKDEAGRITFAVDNPWDLNLQESLRTLVRQGYQIAVSSKSDILRVITDVYGFRKAVSAAEEQITVGVDIGNLEQLFQLTNVEELESNDRHIVKAVEYLLHYAFEQRASDIHLEPKREEGLVRLRIDGVLHTVYRMPKVVHNAVTSRIKTMCRMDIAERRRPQDGRFKTIYNDRETELRVSSLPVSFGEKIVMRVFNPDMLLTEIASLGFFEGELSKFREFIHRPFGMVLITGPTGSGKTTTLYSSLQELAAPEVNITTIEDPIEMVHEPFNQVAVHRRINLTFAEALRNVLRQDPDIVMLGEIRDSETAEMSTQAALTGHLVLSTLHTNDAPSAITRLLDLGVPNFMIASTLTGVMAQRLVRKICLYCKTETELTEEQAAILGVQLPPGSEQRLPVWHGAGCAHCRGTGFYGRTGIYEVMPVDSGIRRLIKDNAEADEIRREATANGMTTLREAAIRNLALGHTSFDEVIRVLGDTA